MKTFNVDWEKLRAFCQSLMMKEGMSADDALICADNLVDADLAGVESHGVSRMTNYMKRLRTGVVSHDHNITIRSERAASLAVDAGNVMGMVAGTYTMKKCMEKAKIAGSCFATVNHSNHFGRASYYAQMATDAGFIGVAGTNAPPNIAPWGSTQKWMGTNPIAIGVPTHSKPIILDMAPSVVAMGKIILAAKLGKKIPEGWVLDPDGKPTTDPVVGQYGTLIPIGGPKGSGIAIMMEIFCGILADAACGPHINHFWKDFEHPQDVGHFFMALDISAYMDPNEFCDRVEALVSELKALPKKEGVNEIFMPGELEIDRTIQRKANGIDVPESVYNELQALSDQYKVAFDVLR